MDLIKACSIGNLTRVDELLTLGLDPNFQCQNEWYYKDGTSPLLVAGEKGHLDCIKALVSANANINIQGSDGWTPLMYAVVYKRIDCINFLLDMGADPTIKNKAGKKAVDIAKNYDRTKIIKILEEERFMMIKEPDPNC
jgi:ankyrin repeat protein